MSWVRIWVHLLFSTKNREPYLHQSVRKKVFWQINQNKLIEENLNDRMKILKK